MFNQNIFKLMIINVRIKYTQGDLISRFTPFNIIMHTIFFIQFKIPIKLNFN